jgi:type II secretory pathway pseudopilin PulG
MVIIIIGILAGIAVIKMTSQLETARYEATMTEMEQLARAIVGNHAISSRGARADFGYVGDNGSLPPNLDALAVNPGLATWDGPYISSATGSEYRNDAWGVAYIYTDTLLRSIGSGTAIEKVFALSTADLLDNTVSGFCADADYDLPGAAYRDSLRFILTYPDGTGGMTEAVASPRVDGSFAYTGIPVGNHALRVIYIPDSDTAAYTLSVLPGRTSRIDITFPADLW